jgi:hypothetical protein
MSELDYLAPCPEFDQNFLGALAESAQNEMSRHRAERKEWNYHDTLTREKIAELAELPPIEVDDAVRYIYLGNLAVEKGHAEYDRITSDVFEQNPVFREWKNTWVAEEEPHGDAMLQWAKISGMWDGQTMHNISQGYIKHGSSLAFYDAATGLAYPAFQEIATRLTHKAVKDLLPPEAKEGKIILAKIIGDEERHERFYANMVRHGLHNGDTAIASHQMRGVARALLGFRMPGMEDDIPEADRKRINSAYKTTGAFTIHKLVKTVLLPVIIGKGSFEWDIQNVEDLDYTGRLAQQRIIKFVDDTEKIGNSELRSGGLILKNRKEVSLK